MCSTPLNINRDYFFIVDHLESWNQIVLMFLVNMISVTVNIVMFYVTILNSEKESKTYRVVSFVHNFSLFLAQFFWGSILNPIPLLPLPGVLSIGILRTVLRTFVLLVFWIFLFAFSILMMYVIMLIRLKALARNNGVFQFRNSTYSIFLLIIAVLIFYPILSRMLPYNVSDEQMKFHLNYHYLNCSKLSDHPGFFVFANPCKSSKGVFVVLISLFGGAAFYLSVCGVIIYEIRMQSTRWSLKRARNHMTVLKHTIVQNIFRFLFLAIAPAVVLRNTFLPPEADTTNLTLFANCMFTAAPIPCSIVILAQNSNYRNFFVSKFHIFKRTQHGNNHESRTSRTNRKSATLF